MTVRFKMIKKHEEKIKNKIKSKKRRRVKNQRSRKKITMLYPKFKMIELIVK